MQYFDGEDDWIANIHDEFVRIDKTGGNNGKASKRASQSKPVDDDDDLMMGGGDNTDFDFFDQDEEEELAIIPQKAAAKTTTEKTSPRLSMTNASNITSTRFSLDSKREFDSSPESTQYRETLMTTTAMDDLDADILAPTQATQSHQQLDEYQTKNRDIITSQLTYLHPRGVLFVGSILTVKLPSPTQDSAIDGRILFRVLFIEGGNQPAMFRCKTPIFTSTSVSVEASSSGEEVVVVHWNEDTFRFDMVMPSVDSTNDDENNKVDSPFIIQGEVMISIYRARSNGGNDLLGQLAVDLKVFRTRGTVEFFAPGSEGRSMNGVYPLLLPGSKTSVGEMEIQFNIAWKGTAADPPASSTPVPSAMKAGGKIAPNTSVKSVGKSTSKSGSNSKAGGSRPQSAGPRARPSSSSALEKPNLNNHVNGKEPRKIISKLQRKMKEDERRIKRENELLQHKIAKHTSSSTHSSQPGGATTAPATATTTAYGTATAAKPSVQQAYQEPINPAVEKHTNTWQTLAGAHEQLKKALRDDENSLKDMRSKLSNLNTNIARQEAGIDRVKMISNIQQHSHHSGSHTYGHDSARQSITSLQPSTTATAIFQLGKLENVADGQYHQIKEEYEVLQRMRRSFVERRQQAEVTRTQSLSQATAVQQKIDVATKRLLHFAAEFPSLIPSAEGEADAKQQQSSQRSESKQHDDKNELNLSLLDSLRSITAEQATVTTLQEDNHELMQLLAARAELEAILHHLDKQAASVKKDIHSTLDQKQALLLEFQESKEHQDELQSRRSIVTLMKGLELKLRREQRMRVLSDGVRDIELQMVRLKMLAVERQQLGIIAESTRPAAIINGYQDQRHLLAIDAHHHHDEQHIDGEQHAKVSHTAKLAEQDLQDLYEIVN